MKTLSPGDFEVIPPTTAAPAAPLQAVGGMRVLDPNEFQEVEQPGQATSAARGALQGATLGFGDELAAGIDTAVSQVPGVRSLAQAFQSGDLPALDDPNITYQQRRDAYRAKNAAAQEANPLTYGAGELAGGLAVPIPGGAAKTLMGAALQGALLGGAGALGSSNADLTQGQYGRAASDVLHGAGIGAALGGSLHAIGSKIGGGAEDRAIAGATEDAASRARLKDANRIARAAAADKGASDLAGRDVILSEQNRPIFEAARAGKTDQALEEMKPRLADLESQKATPYATVEKAMGQVPTKAVSSAIDARIADLAKVEGTQATRKALTAMKEDIEQVRGADATIPVRDMRSLLTKAQDTAVQAANANGVPITQHALVRAEAERALRSALDEHLTMAAGKSPAARAAVQQIQNINKEQSTLLAFKAGLEQRAAKEAAAKPTLMQQLGHAGASLTHMGGIGAALAGHPAGLAALAMPGAMKLIGRGARLGNDTLARLLYNAGRGDQRALGMLMAIRKLPAVSAGLAGEASAP